MDKIKLYSYSRTLSGDLDTPVSIYLNLNTPKSFLLESVTGGESVGRYSIIGLNPLIEYRVAEDGTGTISGLVNGSIEHPIDSLQGVFDQLDVDLSACRNFPFAGGAVGFMGWESMAYMDKLAPIQKADLGIPMVHFLFPGTIVVMDHAYQTISVIIFHTSANPADVEPLFDDLISRIRQPIAAPYWAPAPIYRNDPYKIATSNTAKADFLERVKIAQRHIYEGDIFQLVYSQKFSVPQQSEPFAVYRRLRQINPSPYMFYVHQPEYQIIGSSPEILVKLTDGHAELRPIAGTRPRSAVNESEVVAELKADEKERAEHIMLVDLGRNDLGRVCEFGSVSTRDLMEIEKYSHVMHMITHVEGQLQTGKTPIDLLKATFPAGTVSGAPKIRAVDIINRLEPDKRGLYAGALGYIGFNGNMDMCIAIRSILAHNDCYVVQAGGGIVADSVPELEFEESRNKARGMLQACLEGDL